MKIRIGTRESRLAVVQTELAAERLRQVYPELELEIVPMKTTGDRILHKTLDKIGGKGLFVKELDMALLEGRIDLAVHSLKDMPMEENPEIPVLAYSAREDVRDVLVLPKGAGHWDRTLPVGCSSFRRRIQLEALEPGIRVESIRGNVLTRLEKLDAGQYGALVLAAAGLKRLNLEERIFRYFEPEEILPAAGQGILAVQGRPELASLCRCLDHKKERFLAGCERAFVRELNGGCSSPVAAHGRIVRGERLNLRGLYYEEETGRYQTGGRELFIRSWGKEEAEEAGRSLADEMRSAAGSR